MSTIYALSSAQGPAGVAVFRISGPLAAEALHRLTRRAPPPPRRAALREIYDPETGETIDHGIVLWFAAPASATGEHIAELHIHGGRALAAAMLRALGRIPGLRLAEPGAFLRRAFEAGKLDLARIEGLADLIDAETEGQRRAALRLAEGALSGRVAGWRERLVRALAYAEAGLDFPDEADVPGTLFAAVRADLADLAAEIGADLARAPQGERLRDGVSVAIVGPPNAGKSSLLNALAAREVAIVSETAGTTRDVLEIHLDLDGVPLVVADTAGLRAAAEAVEAEGVRRALGRAAAADLRILLFDSETAPRFDSETLALARPGDLAVLNKSDLVSGTPELLGVPAGVAVFPLSVRFGSGMEAFLRALGARAAALTGAGEPLLVTRARHREALAEVEACLRRSLAAPAQAEELAIEDLRLAVRALGRITGQVDVEEVLDAIFGAFCIGK